MSDRYQQPAPGTLLDTWGQVLNQNFTDIDEDVTALEAGKADASALAAKVDRDGMISLP